MNIKSTKKRGELGEIYFLLEATKRKFIVSKPSGDSCEYDFIIDLKGKLNKIQIKSIWSIDKSKNRQKSKSRYITKAGKGKNKTPYTYVDFIIIFINDYNTTWYIIPINKLKGVNVCLYPHRESKGIYEEFKNAWYLLE